MYYVGFLQWYNASKCCKQVSPAKSTFRLFTRYSTAWVFSAREAFNTAVTKLVRHDCSESSTTEIAIDGNLGTFLVLINSFGSDWT
mmetsp:Transcript_23271/g.37065  ORF Transcript_23271/g.37065 Transcript_23271/m.37065 type:complete len:86 (+) Transcript_23271:1111-1368(+)